MKKRLTVIFLAALTAQAQWQFVDVTTKVTNTTFSAAQITITNEGAATLLNTNAHYWAFNSNNVQIGDSLPVAFGKENFNWYTLGQMFYSAYGTNVPGLIPLMTSSNTPSGLATASSVFMGEFPAWYAFGTNAWEPSSTDLSPWLEYQFASPQTAYAVSFYQVSVYSNNLTFQYSTDGATWNK